MSALSKKISSKAPSRSIWLVLAFLLATLNSGCGVFTDLARDNNFHIGSLGLLDFVSPVKLRVGILPFRDEVGLGTPEAGPNMAVLMSDRFAENNNVVVVSPNEVAQTARAMGWTGHEPLTPEMAMELGRQLRLNVVMDGAISQIQEQTQRRGWRRLVRFFTNQQQYIDTVLTLVAFDSATGLVISARAGESSYKMGQSESDPFAASSDSAITQQSIEQGLDLAIEDTYFRTLDGLAYTPFKAMVVVADGSYAEIPFGRNVGIRRGLELVSLSAQETLTSSIDISYVIPGAAKARLRVTEVGEDSSKLEIYEGSVYTGEFIQTQIKD
ncbi:MAG: hypothetical protein LBJ64_08865 [Deltaproteobacteria bacterium]|jgi:hypothetical protein|nr:hypothetical protein [Deltaproteobacteria bacterium]